MFIRWNKLEANFKSSYEILQPENIYGVQLTSFETPADILNESVVKDIMWCIW